MDKKRQTTIYLSVEDERRINRLLSFFLLANDKKTRSDLFCEGIKLLHDRELKKGDGGTKESF